MNFLPVIVLSLLALGTWFLNDLRSRRYEAYLKTRAVALTMAFNDLNVAGQLQPGMIVKYHRFGAAFDNKAVVELVDGNIMTLREIV